MLVLKKLGDELTEEFAAVLKYLALEAGMNVIVEPEEHVRLVRTQTATLCTTYLITSFMGGG